MNDINRDVTAMWIDEGCFPVDPPPRPKVERMEGDWVVLYGTNWAFASGETIDLKQDNDGVWK